MGEMRYRWAEFLMKAFYEKKGFDVIHNGAPDLILLKDGRIQFIEIKCKNDKATEEQERAIRLLKKHGYTARTERIKCFKNNQEPGYHTIRVLRREVGRDQTFHRLSEWVLRIINK